MKVAHIIDSGGYYGAEAMLVNLCIEQIKNSVSVLVISIGTRKNPLKPLEKKLTELNIPYIRWNMLPLPDLRESFKILDYCLNNQIDIIHSHGYKGNILLGLIPISWRKLPVISTIHGYTKHKLFSKMTIYQTLDKFCISKLDAVVLVSPSMKSQVPGKKIGQKLYIIDNGIPTEDLDGNRKAYISLFQKDDLRIGSLGRLSYEKNFAMLVEAFSTIIRTLPHAKLVIYGEGPERATLESQIHALGLGDKVFLPGFLRGTTAFFKDIDVFVNCSLTEGMPISIIESMRNGCPVIATDIPANKTLLEPLNPPELFCTISAASLAKALINFFEKRSTYSIQIAPKYTDAFMQKHTIGIMFQKYQSLYRLVQENESI
jgi:glycosyltransferase involved in cell wall biosynthesis